MPRRTVKRAILVAQQLHILNSRPEAYEYDRVEKYSVDRREADKPYITYGEYRYGMKVAYLDRLKRLPKIEPEGEDDD